MPKLSVPIRPKSIFFVITTFQMLKMEVRFECTGLIAKVETFIAGFFSNKLRKIKNSSGSISGKVKKIEAQAK